MLCILAGIYKLISKTVPIIDFYDIDVVLYWFKGTPWDTPAALSNQRWADAISMWPNAVKTFNRPSGIQIVCLGYFWFHRNVD